MKSFIKTVGRGIVKCLPIIVGVGLVSGICFADGSDVTIQTIASNMQSTVSSVANIISNVALVVGLSLVCASFFKLKQHKDQPTQVPISNGVTLLVIGAALTVFPLLLPTANQAAFGSGVTTGTVGGDDMKTLIGGAS